MNGIVCGFIQIVAYTISMFLENVGRILIFRITIFAIFAASTFFIMARLYSWDTWIYYDYVSIAIIGLEFLFSSLGQSIVFIYPIEAFST